MKDIQVIIRLNNYFRGGFYFLIIKCVFINQKGSFLRIYGMVDLVLMAGFVP